MFISCWKFWAQSWYGDRVKSYTNQTFLHKPVQGLQQLQQLKIPADSVVLGPASEVSGWLLFSSPGRKRPYFHTDIADSYKKVNPNLRAYLFHYLFSKYWLGKGNMFIFKQYTILYTTVLLMGFKQVPAFLQPVVHFVINV